MPGISIDTPPEFKIIETDNNDVFIPLNKLLNCENKNKINDAFKNKIIFDEFLRDFNPKKLEKKNPKKKLIVEDDSDGEEVVKKPKIKLVLAAQRTTRSSSKDMSGGKSEVVQQKYITPVDITQPLTSIMRTKEPPLMEQQIIQKPIISQLSPPSPPDDSSSSTSVPSSIPSSVPSSITESDELTQDVYLNNLIEYLKNVLESIIFINSTYTNTYSNEHINDFIIKLYLSNIKQNINSFSQGLTIENIISILQNYTNKSDPTLNEGLYIKNTFNSIFQNFDKIQNLISSAIELEQEEDIELGQSDEMNISQEGGYISKVTFESINNKMDNIFYFTQNRVEILNECYNNNQQVKDIINFYNNIILKLNEYLVGYINDIYSLENSNIDGMNSFIGIYCFYMYFSIEFNRQLNNTPEINNSITSNDQNILQQIFSGIQLLDWISEFIEGEVNLFESNDINLNYTSINESMKSLPYNQFMVNDKNFMLQSINSKVNNSIFTTNTRDIPLQIITAFKSLYYLLDESFIENYMNNKYVDVNSLNNLSPVAFLEELYDSNLYGLIDTNNKYNYYINDEGLNSYIEDLLYFKKEGQQKQEYDSDLQPSKRQRIQGGTQKNKKSNKKNNKTKNKNKKVNKKKTYKKKGKKVRQNTISNK